MTERYCVLHKNPGYSRDKAAYFLAGERCISRTEAAAAVRKNPGFLLENASLNKSSAFNLRASAYGFETILLSYQDLKEPPPALPVSKVELKTEGFYYTCGGVREHVSYETVRLLTACAFDVELPRKNEPAIMEAGLINSLRARYFPFPPLIGGEREKPPAATPPDCPLPAGFAEMALWAKADDESPLPPEAPARETIFLADIFTGPSAPVRLHIPCDEQDYSGIGPKKSLSSLENFRVLLGELSVRSFGTRGNIFLNAFLKQEPIVPLKCTSIETYETELAWLCTILSI
ncbi:MAG: hypothetical protein A2270_05180 [Elusimicrobia bacterium RIFOXYA12_FULL_51_18]|nr:MAG: hypothetical protein A2270_05180 [Elusimicrobia bacterium RIFOXYA12_FULL_51_18]OGS30877.1 MAG: hypothetical protein A2218_09985 [Elusimicrobia bacterium RIFOXYA2_FULL_53_38]